MNDLKENDCMITKVISVLIMESEKKGNIVVVLRNVLRMLLVSFKLLWKMSELDYGEGNSKYTQRYEEYLQNPYPMWFHAKNMWVGSKSLRCVQHYSNKGVA